MSQVALDLIRGRRSIRHFRPHPLEPDSIDALIEAAINAPSAGNAQPWRFFFVGDQSRRESLVQAALGQSFIAEAPLCIVVCVDLNRARASYGERGVNLYCLQDTAAAIQNMALTAYSLGLGTCWVGAFDEGAAASILELPDHLRPVAMLPVGVPAEAPAPRGRRPSDEVVEWR